MIIKNFKIKLHNNEIKKYLDEKKQFLIILEIKLIII